MAVIIEAGSIKGNNSLAGGTVSVSGREVVWKPNNGKGRGTQATLPNTSASFKVLMKSNRLAVKPA